MTHEGYSNYETWTAALYFKHTEPAYLYAKFYTLLSIDKGYAIGYVTDSLSDYYKARHRSPAEINWPEIAEEWLAEARTERALGNW